MLMTLLRRKDLDISLKSSTLEKYCSMPYPESQGEEAEVEAPDSRYKPKDMLLLIAKEGFIGYTMTFSDLPEGSSALEPTAVLTDVFHNVPDKSSQTQIDNCYSILEQILPQVNPKDDLVK